MNHSILTFTAHFTLYRCLGMTGISPVSCIVLQLVQQLLQRYILPASETAAVPVYNTGTSE